MPLHCHTNNTRLGKQWHAPKKAFRPGSGLTPYEQRAKARVAQAAAKAKERELKEEKEAERKVRGATTEMTEQPRNANHQPYRDG